MIENLGKEDNLVVQPSNSSISIVNRDDSNPNVYKNTVYLSGEVPPVEELIDPNFMNDDLSLDSGSMKSFNMWLEAAEDNTRLPFDRRFGRRGTTSFEGKRIISDTIQRKLHELNQINLNDK